MTSWFLGAPPRGATGGHGGPQWGAPAPCSTTRAAATLLSGAPRSPLGGALAGDPGREAEVLMKP